MSSPPTQGGSSGRYGSDEPATPASVAARRSILAATAAGQLDAVRPHLGNDHAHVRAAALVAMHRLDALTIAVVECALDDPSPLVRRQLAQLGASAAHIPLARLTDDPDERVVEMSAWALGERVEVSDEDLRAVIALSTDHLDALCREAAVAALGAIGDERGLAAILTATGDKATVRRRAVLALAPFDTPEVDAALNRALSDRDWQVRQAAEDLLQS